MDVKFEKLNKSNYLQWSMRMRSLLKLEDCLNAIEFNTSILTDEQRKEDEKCKSLLYLGVDKDNMDIIRECTTSTEIWNKLKETHTEFDCYHAILVLKEFVHLEMDQNENILEYVNRKNHLYTKVQGSGFNFEKKVLMGLMLIGLPMKYDYLKKAIQIHDDSLTPASLEMKLVEEERHLNNTATRRDSFEYLGVPPKMEVDRNSNANESQCHSNYLQIKTEQEEVEIKLEDLHHSIEIKEETSILESQPDREFKPYKCKICNFSSACKVSLNIHLRTHTGEKPFTCEICGYKCAQQGNLNVHLRTHSGDKPFGCDFCDYKTANKGRIKSHLRTHTGEKPFSCETCDYKCAHKAALKVHLRTHTGEKPFACDICSQKFTQRVHYINHLRTHTGEKPFVCEICDFRCADHGYLKIHLRAHTGAKPFTCEICNYTCAYQPNFKTHLKTHSGVKPFSCEICGYKCTRKGNLNIHLKTHTEQK